MASTNAAPAPATSAVQLSVAGGAGRPRTVGSAFDEAVAGATA